MTLHVDACTIELRLSPPVLGWAHAREFDEIADEMSLIAIAAFDSNLRPIDPCGALPDRKYALEALHPTKQLRCQTNFHGEHVAKSPLAQVHRLRNVANLHLAMRPHEQVQAQPNSTVAHRRIGQPCHQCFQPCHQCLLQELKPRRRVPQYTQAFAELSCCWSPKRP
jgi:hypothetical protein